MSESKQLNQNIQGLRSSKERDFREVIIEKFKNELAREVSMMNEVEHRFSSQRGTGDHKTQPQFSGINRRTNNN